MKTLVLALFLVLPFGAARHSHITVTTTYGGSRYHNCPPVGKKCIRDADLIVDNNSKEAALVTYKGQRYTVRPWARLEFNAESH